jgi:shikimate kinase
MTVPENIFLVGPMGAGKTTVGRQLALALEKEFLDSDREIETRTGASISLIFDLEGEEGFRKREAAMIDVLTQRRGIVLATGGGAVLDDGNRAVLRSRGFVIYLWAPIERLWQRTSRDRKRPLLQADDPRTKLEAIVTERDPLYRQVADMIVKADQRSPRHVLKGILKQLKSL